MYKGIFFGDFPRTDIPVGLNGANRYVFQATRRLNLNRFYATGVRLCGENEPVIVTIDQEVKRAKGWFYVGRIQAVEEPAPDERIPFTELFASVCPTAYHYDDQPHDAAGGYDEGIADALRALAELDDEQAVRILARARKLLPPKVWVDEAAQIPDAAWKDIQRAVENPVTVAQKGVVSET